MLISCLVVVYHVYEVPFNSQGCHLDECFTVEQDNFSAGKGERKAKKYLSDPFLLYWERIYNKPFSGITQLENASCL